GYWHTCALPSFGGTIKCWGYNLHGQVGDGTAFNRLVPVDVTGLPTGLSAGGYHTGALTAGGRLQGWGAKGSGQPGGGAGANYRPPPVEVSGLGITGSVAAGRDHTCALTAAGGVKCWGSNFDGQVGDGSPITSYYSAVDVTGLTNGVAAVAAGDNHTCALTTG